jgi:hypothetical protein
MEGRMSKSLLKSYTAVAPVHDAVEAEFLPVLHALKKENAHYRWIGAKGDLVAFLTQLEINPGRAEPTLCLANKRTPTERHVYIPLSHLWMMIEPNAMQVAVPQLAERLYGFVTRADCMRVLDAVYEFAEDLKNAPPPRWLTVNQWMRAIAEDGMASRINGNVVMN